MMTTSTENPTVPVAERPAQRRGFRRDIHGLRGLGIVLVVAYHLWTSGEVSGGVDIFLIISAYLMTGSMVRKGSSFNIVTFLIQRFRRLVPQAAIVIAATLAVGWFFLPPFRQPALLEHARSSLFYVENWTLIDQAVSYAAVDAGQVSPFQHFWSLSVQGQIFVTWPLLFGVGLLASHWLKRPLKTMLAALFGAVFCASFGYALLAIAADSAAAYFDTFARAWEFALASLLALLPKLKLPRPATLALGWAGLATVLASGFVVGKGDFPGPVALMPALGAAAILMADLRSDRPGDPAYWLSRRPVGFVANRAYALYLWHWPVYAYYMVFTETAPQRLPILPSVLVLGLSLVLADITTRLVERRFHAWERLDTKRGALSAIAVFLIIVLGIVEGMGQALDREDSRAAAGENPGAKAATPRPLGTPTPARRVAPGDSSIRSDRPLQMSPCDITPKPPLYPGGNCFEVKPEHPEKTVLLIGDSHSYQWSTALVPLAQERNWHLIMPNHPKCRVTTGSEWSNPDCLAYSRDVVDLALALHPDYVVSIGSRARPDGPEIEVETYAEAIRPIAEAGITMVQIRDNPRWGFTMPDCVQRWGVESPRCSAPRREKLADHWPRSELEELPNQVFLDFSDYVCPGGPDAICPGVIGNVYVYMDDNHLSRSYVETLRDEFVAQWDTRVP